jgi:hypothetical protein
MGDSWGALVLKPFIAKEGEVKVGGRGWRRERLLCMWPKYLRAILLVVHSGPTLFYTVV